MATVDYLCVVADEKYEPKEPNTKGGLYEKHMCTDLVHGRLVILGLLFGNGLGHGSLCARWVLVTKAVRADK